MQMDFSAPETPHLIATDVYRLYGGDKIGIGDTEIAILQDKLDAIYPDLQEAYHAILALLAFSQFLKKRNDFASAKALMDLVRNQRHQFKSIQHLMPDVNETPDMRFTQPLTLKRAPRQEERPPDGSFKAASLLPNPALRRPAARK